MPESAQRPLDFVVAENLKRRVLAALSMLVLLLVALFALPPLYWSLAMLVVLLLAAHEWAELARMSKRTSLLFLTGALVIALKLIWIPGFAQGEGWPNWLTSTMSIASLIFWLALAPLWLAFGWRVQTKLGLVLAGWLVLITAWFALVELQTRSPLLCLALMAIVWVADTAAYFVGHRFGKHKLAPTISPGKTWEGVYGALVAVAIYAAILAALAPRLGYAGMFDLTRLAVWVGAGLALTVISIIGDLFESWLKRVRGVKDSGTLIPGHGGVLDRIDALTASMPAAVLLAQTWLR